MRQFLLSKLVAQILSDPRFHLLERNFVFASKQAFDIIPLRKGMIVLKLIEVISSNIEAIGYENGVIEVHFHSGGVYRFLHVPKDVFDAFLEAPSKGHFFHQYVKSHYPFQVLKKS